MVVRRRLVGEVRGEDVATEQFTEPIVADLCQVEVVVGRGSIGLALCARILHETIRRVDEGPAQIRVYIAVGEMGRDVDIDRVTAELERLDESRIEFLAGKREFDAGLGSEALFKHRVVVLPERPFILCGSLQGLIVEIEDRRVGQLGIAPKIIQGGS